MPRRAGRVRGGAKDSKSIQAMAVLTKHFVLGACPVSTVKNWIYASMPKVDHVSIVTSTWSNWHGTSWYCTSCQDASAFSITLLMFAIAASDVNLTFRGRQVLMLLSALRGFLMRTIEKWKQSGRERRKDGSWMHRYVVAIQTCLENVLKEMQCKTL